MGIRDNRMDSCTDGREMSGNSRYRAVLGIDRKRFRLCRLFALTFVLLGLGGPVFGQFTVQPMKLDLQVTSGKLLPQVIDIRNTDTENTHTIDISIIDLAQDINGGWEIIEPNSDYDSSKLASLKDSIRIDPTSVTLTPGQETSVEVLIRVPRGTRGFACAGILATLRSVAGADVSVRLRFMVPVILQVVSRSVSHKVYPVDVGMEFIKAGLRGPGSPATTLLSMDIENTGPTFPRCRPLARIWSWAGGHWRIVKTTGFQDLSNDIGIIPGAKVTVRTDLMKSLPPGKYKIAGELYVDGRRTRRIDKEIEFTGDPDITEVAVDAALDLDQREIVIDALPGSTRTTMMRVQNGADATVNVQAVLGLPREMASAVLGNVRGVDMDCTPWVKIDPDRFTLTGEGGTQIVTITVTMPESAVNSPNYYTNLDFWSFYPDGQNAGRTRAKLVVSNSRYKVEPKAWVSSMNSYHVTGSKYQIVGRFNNPSLTHLTPIKCKAAITQLVSTIPRVSTDLTSEERGFMLPFEYRNFSGIIDLSALDPGDYRLSVAIEYAPGQWQSKQAAVRITIEGGRRILETTGTEAELKQVLEVKWSKAPEEAIENKERG